MIFLIIEDNPDIVESCTLTLRVAWPEGIIMTTELGEEGITIIERERPDIVILDLGLPDISGFKVIKDVRLFSCVPILVLTVRDDEESVVKAFEIGADEYVIKPFRHLELISRIKKMVQRRDPTKIGTRINIGKFTFDPYNNQIITHKHEIRLTNNESRILLVLI
jgi:DNA-binding response OmpR family regulator